MALDEVLLEQSIDSADRSRLLLRFYGWQPDAVSIGYGQRLAPSRLDSIKDAGFDVVKRPTGGRAVLHSGELTYSFVGHESLLGKSISSAYAKICSGLIAGFDKLGLSLTLGDSSSERGSYRDKEDCFMAITTADLKLDGKKLVGSAQLRRGEWILQHGSILLDQGQDLMPELLGSRLESSRHANLFDYLESPISLSELTQVISSGFEESFESSFVVSELASSEIEEAGKLRERYSLRLA